MMPNLFLFHAEKCRSFLTEYYGEGDKGMKDFKYAQQLVRVVFFN